MNEFLLVLTGGGICLVSSVIVTWLHSRHVHRGEARTAARESTRQLTALFIAERDAALEGDGPTDGLAEAEMLSIAVADRRVRDRVRAAIRLLRELHLPELQELSGQRPEAGRRLLCDHALEVLGAHYRGEKPPAVPPEMQRMLTVEDEALNIHTGGAPAPAPAAPSTPAPAATAEPAADKEKKTATRKPGRRPRSTSTAASAAPSSAAPSSAAPSAGAATETEERPASRRRTAKSKTKDPEESDFWND
ncbi:hypothetical protein [Nocardiopsis composta]|uniref:Ribosomal protein L12E/L44/L45/RPP1/RPP2 n=1 Tax=Nocardiopsis composta TaxID=157465 RepID=A0A7W8QNG3_9ACTN|nr:hypothetical protein [Nocardiopsis composta]MBB5433474.1 ribosomal protein L12E/L44/L45/RPP1/RPP2 [Nocardiopsis composta]